MKETAVTDRIVKGICGVPDACARKRHSGKFGSGEPDVTACFRGRALYIETKMIDGTLSELQAHQLTRWRSAGAVTAIAIYHPDWKQLRVVELCDSEKWEEFAGSSKKVAELWETTGAAVPQKLSEFDWHGWLETNVGDRR